MRETAPKMMTEDGWLTSRSGEAMLDFLQTATEPVRTRWLGWKSAKRFPHSERKVRLVEAACCERIADLLPTPQLRNLIDVARQVVGCEADQGERSRSLERDADSLIQQVFDKERPETGSPRFLAMIALGWLFGYYDWEGRSVLGHAASARAFALADGPPSAANERRWNLARDAECAHQADIVREVIGNPFRRESLDPVWLRANDRAATRIAGAIAEGGAFADLPILADALEDAGCANHTLLEHLRGAGPHVVGCWALDIVLGKG